jgi:DUF438 domain-containing protein
MRKKKDIIAVLTTKQRELLRTLRTQVKDIESILKLLAHSQDPDAVNKEQMEFLGTIGARFLTEKELEMAKNGIPIDELRKITGRKIQASESRDTFRESLPEGHVIRMIYAEHELLLYFLCDLEALNTEIQRMSKWKDNPKAIEKIGHIIAHICDMDLHQTREEEVILPQLEAHGYDEIPQHIFAEHKRLHKGRVELKKLADSTGKMEFDRWQVRLDNVVNDFIPAVRKHIQKEESVLYPKALKVIQDPQMWKEMKAACDEKGLDCF